VLAAVARLTPWALGQRRAVGRNLAVSRRAVAGEWLGR
jgi:hypothetical protein